MAPCKSVILTEGLPWVKNIKSNQIKSTFEFVQSKVNENDKQVEKRKAIVFKRGTYKIWDHVDGRRQDTFERKNFNDLKKLLNL